jgi:hypothetical protein
MYHKCKGNCKMKGIRKPRLVCLSLNLETKDVGIGEPAAAGLTACVDGELSTAEQGRLRCR